MRLNGLWGYRVMYFERYSFHSWQGANLLVWLDRLEPRKICPCQVVLCGAMMLIKEPSIWMVITSWDAYQTCVAWWAMFLKTSFLFASSILYNICFAIRTSLLKVEEATVSSSLYMISICLKALKQSLVKRVSAYQAVKNNVWPWVGPWFPEPDILIFGRLSSAVGCQDRICYWQSQHTRATDNYHYRPSFECGGARWSHPGHAGWSHHWTGRHAIC